MLSQQEAVRGFYFDVAAGNCRFVEVEVERLPHARRCHESPLFWRGRSTSKESPAIRVGRMSSRRARPEKLVERDEPPCPISRTAGGRQAHRVDACASSKSR